MGTEKGLFRDDLDRNTETHQRICMWLLQNADFAIRRMFFDRPKGAVKVIMEHLVENNGFIIGFTDVLMEYETDGGSKEFVLFEVKSRMEEPSACLRQLRAYKQYLTGVTNVCVIHADERYSDWNEADNDMRRFFTSQGIYVVNFNAAPSWNALYCLLPTGRREVKIQSALPSEFDFNIYLVGRGLDASGKDVEDQQCFLLRGLDFIDPFCEFAGVDPTPWKFDWSLLPFKELPGMKLLVDVEHFPGDFGHPQERFTALHRPDLSRSLTL